MVEIFFVPSDDHQTEMNRGCLNLAINDRQIASLFLSCRDKSRPFDGDAFGKVQNFSGVILAQKAEGSFKRTAAFAVLHPFNAERHFADADSTNGGFVFIRLKPFKQRWKWIGL